MALFSKCVENVRDLRNLDSGGKMIKVLFYSPVEDMKLFEYTGFYRMDQMAMNSLGWNITFTNNLRKVARPKDYDILFTYFWTYSAFALIIAKFFGKTTISTGGADDLDPIFNSSRKKYFTRKIFFLICYLFSDSVLAVSNKDAENMSKIIRRGKKISVSRHPLENVYPNKSNKTEYISTVAWMVPIANVQRKGIDRLIKVFGYMKEMERFKNFRLRIIGTEGQGSEYLREIARKNNILDIDFLGVVSEEEKMAELDASLLYGQLSEYEGFGLAALEALSSGCIVIHSGRGGLEEVVNSHGIKVNLNESDEMIAEKIALSLVNFNTDQSSLELHLGQFSIEKRAESILIASRRKR